MSRSNPSPRDTADVRQGRWTLTPRADYDISARVLSRENYHFDQLAAEVLPQVAAKRIGTRRVRLWSDGCSTGEEPYSLAIVLREALAHFEEIPA